ncbi:4-hydroxyphenylpyruvate dioxygenase [Streptomyces sp. BV333]|uniref:4-hydroxyphenylpyruvate dioxygenase n=1 Tax=Streptomyces sp. BV333 TaxID=2849673 RepID=UPI001C2E77F7|nr:4-hydroxyphenylpyruvate dioxygenase [Streptomyces sp. BV333]MBV1957419.1 4-hydroxyphenylpyruvate dioxygenase [Streptomyces sp. BV333]
MAVRDISHVELYTRDKIATVDFLVSSMGFTRVADSVAFDRSSVLLRQGDAQLVVTSGWVTGKWLSEYGDGVADIAVTCDDASETARAALTSGARVTSSPHGFPVVSGWGAVSHTLFPAAATGSSTPPPGHKWTASPGAPEEPTGHIRRYDHIAIRLEANPLKDYAAFCAEVLGLSLVPDTRPSVGGRTAAPLVARSVSERVAFVLTTTDAHHGAGARDTHVDPEEPPGTHRLAFLADDDRSGTYEYRHPGMPQLRLCTVGHASRQEFGTVLSGLASGTRSPVG